MSLRMRVETEIARSLTKFYRELLGKGPEETRVYIIDDMLFVRFRGTLTREEQQLVKTERGCQLVKEMREEIRSINVDEEEKIISVITSCQVLSSQSNINTKTGDVLVSFMVDQNLGKALGGKSCGKEAGISQHPL